MLPLWDTEKSRRRPVMTTLLVAANVGVFIYQLLLMLKGGRATEVWLYRHALVPGRLVESPGDVSQWMTVLTSMFLHGGVAHVLGNCWFLWIFGARVEERFGPFKFLVFYVIAGAAAASAQVLAHPASAVPMIGASGAISGVLGAYFVLLPGAWIVTLVPWIVPVVPLPAFVFLLVWFAFQTMSGVGVFLRGEVAGGGVAWWAHAGGFIAGVVLTVFARRRKWISARRSK
jgi:membrane associated rhomboid family serine protease